MAHGLLAPGRASSSPLSDKLSYRLLAPGLACVDAAFFLSLGAVNNLRLKLRLSAYEGLVCVAVCTLVAAGLLNTVRLLRLVTAS